MPFAADLHAELFPNDPGPQYIDSAEGSLDLTEEQRIELLGLFATDPTSTPRRDTAKRGTGHPPNPKTGEPPEYG